MFSLNILCFMSNFSFKGDPVYRLILSRGIDLFIPPDSLMGGYNIMGHRNFTPKRNYELRTCQGPYVAAEAGVEPMTLRTKGVDSTNAPHIPHSCIQ